MIQTDDSSLVVNDHDRVLHILENRFVRQRRKLDDLLCEDQPAIQRQHQRENERHE